MLVLNERSDQTGQHDGSQGENAPMLERYNEWLKI